MSEAWCFVKNLWHMRLAYILCMLLFALIASAQPPITAQIVFTDQSIKNEHGVFLPSADGSLNAGALVQILALGVNNTMYPPARDGSPDPDNKVIGETRIGFGVTLDGQHPGQFGAALSPRPGEGTKLFVRVFNASSTHVSSFYGDSDVFTVNWTSNTQFNAVIAATDTPLDADDDDGDGLHNSWESSFGSDPNNTDTDGDGIVDHDEVLRGTNPARSDSDLDGISDPDELLSGTNPMRSDSYLAITSLKPVANVGFHVAWATVTGLMYQIESIEPGTGISTPVLSEIRGKGGDMIAVIPSDAPEMANQWFRLKVFQP